MIAVVLKGIAGRRVRALLTALAVVVGVAMVAGTFILTDSTQQSGLALADESPMTTDAVIYQKGYVKGSAMVNTMVLSVFERTREIGTLRTLGMTPRQTRRMIRHESVIARGSAPCSASGSVWPGPGGHGGDALWASRSPG